MNIVAIVRMHCLDTLINSNQQTFSVGKSPKRDYVTQSGLVLVLLCCCGGWDHKADQMAPKHH